MTPNKKSKEVKKKSSFLKIAQGLGIAIPAGLLLSTNVDTAQVQTVNLQEENEVMERITLTVGSDNTELLADVIHSAHSDHTAHSNHGASS